MNPQQPYVAPPPAPAPNPAPGPAPLPPQAPAPGPMPGPQTPLPSNPYDFIVNPGKAQRVGGGLKLGNSLPQRLLLIGGGALILIILIIVIGNVVSPKSAAGPSLLKVAEVQQELINIATGPQSLNSSQVTLSASHENSAATLQLVMASNQSQLFTYISGIGYKFKPALVTGYSVASDTTQLTSAATDGTYDSAYGDLVQAKLQNYELVLKQAYTKVGGPKGQALLSSQYNQAQLLLQQLGSPAS